MMQSRREGEQGRLLDAALAERDLAEGARLAASERANGLEAARDESESEAARLRSRCDEAEQENTLLQAETLRLRKDLGQTQTALRAEREK